MTHKIYLQGILKKNLKNYNTDEPDAEALGFSFCGLRKNKIDVPSLEKISQCKPQTGAACYQCIFGHIRIGGTGHIEIYGINEKKNTAQQKTESKHRNFPAFADGV